MTGELLFLGKAHKDVAWDAWHFTLQAFPAAVAIFLRPGEQPEEAVYQWAGDWLVSVLCPWIVPAYLLARAAKGALNFHPAPPSYPGIGCTNFALHEGATEYGVTAHVMAARVDTGPIVGVRRFPIWPDDSVRRLTDRAYVHLLSLYLEILDRMRGGQAIAPLEGVTWTRRPTTRRELDALYAAFPRTRATTYP